MLYRFARWFFAAFGLVPVGEAVEAAELNNTLAALRVNSVEREQVLKMAATIAKAGFTVQELQNSLAFIAYATPEQLARFGVQS